MVQDNYQINGFRFNALAAGIKKKGAKRLDFGLIVPDVPANVAGVTTTNLVYAAPIGVMRHNLKSGQCSAIIMNSGNANACCGQKGLDHQMKIIDYLAKEAGFRANTIIPMSTGVIGQDLPVERMVDSIPELARGLDYSKAEQVATSIMTTDTRPKIVGSEIELSNGRARMVGMAKGSGMIAPNMATMLSVIMMDVRLESSVLDSMLKEAVEKTFNRITIDGDMSTNDAVALLSGGAVDSRIIDATSNDIEPLKWLLEDMCGKLAEMLVQDGEGATKKARIMVKNAQNAQDAKRIAKTIAESPLVKTAFNGEDPNWGRIIAAAGRSGACFDPDMIDLYIGDIKVYSNGQLASDDWEDSAAEVMKNKEFDITLDMRSGVSEDYYLTSDLSRDYVSINADYRS